MRCRSCGQENSAGSAYCERCRAALTRPCRACGEPVPSDADRCPACGTATAVPQRPPPQPAAPTTAPTTAARPEPSPGPTPEPTPGPERQSPPPPQTAPPQQSQQQPWSAAPMRTPPAPPASAGGPGGSSPRVPAPVGTARVRGVVRDFQQRRERSLGNTDAELESWHFRIERYDASGNRLPLVPVEMTGLTFCGAVSNGDEVSVEGTWRDGTLRVEELMNLTTNAQVRAKSYRHLRTIVMIIALALFAIVLTVILSSVISMCSTPWPPEFS
ncbi:MAG: hypothetical protein HOV97_01255 [Nonomuraea sp.]|nr:hypothetical protein [Nonomuraea sp.]